MKYQINFEYRHLGQYDQLLRSRGTQVKMDIERLPPGVYVARSVGDDFEGHGKTIKEAILDWLSQCPLV